MQKIIFIANNNIGYGLSDVDSHVGRVIFFLRSKKT